MSDQSGRNLPDIHVGHDPEIVEGKECPCSSIFLDGFDIVVDPPVCQSAAIIGHFELFKERNKRHVEHEESMQLS